MTIKELEQALESYSGTITVIINGEYYELKKGDK